jgi:hypothetical protein
MTDTNSLLSYLLEGFYKKFKVLDNHWQNLC